jgi:tetraacyldisaccharide 4'-kinase
MSVLRSVSVGVPVISIGNITTGGTGKTPLVVNAAKIILDSGKCVAIISRGYGRKTTGTVVVCDGKTILADALSAGDEPLMMAQDLKTAIVIVDEDRVRGAKKAVVEFGAQVIILDDGFQHRYIKRTKDIVVIDAGQMPFDTMLLPAGYRREWIGSLKRASAVVITKTKDEGEAERILKDERLKAVENKFTGSFRPSGIKHLFSGIARSLEIMNGCSAVLFCGIARPENFRLSVEACGIKVKDLFGFPDHHIYTTAEIESVIASFQKHSADVILTTEKDSVRLLEFEHLLMKLPVSVLTMDAAVHQQNEWKQYLLS